MPARGNHEERRQQVAQIAADLVASGGLGAATNRRIAQAAGCSTTVVSHYFADKRDLISATYQQVGDRVVARLDAAAQAPDDQVLAVLEALLPLDDDRSRDWRLLFTFLGLAATDADMSVEQRARAKAAQQRLQDVLTTAQETGGISSDVDIPTAARTLLALVLGIGMQALFDPADWPAVRIRECLQQSLAALREGR